MNEKALKTLEYNKIIEKLIPMAGSVMGKELCRQLKPMTNLADIEKAQKETSDALKRVYQKSSPSFQSVTDIRPSVKRLEIGGTLNIDELLRLANLLETAARVKAYGRHDEEKEDDSLDDLFRLLEPLTPLSSEIRRCILSEDEISDDASSGLKNVRRAIRNTNDKIRSQLNTMVNSQTTRTYLQDFVITMRGGRYCLPVKAEYRGQVPGMIHDQSSTGSTLFVEPMAVVKLNNDLKELAIKEQEEIDRILADLSAQAAEHTEALESNLSVLVQLDFIFAKASLSKSYDGSEPLFNTKGIIYIKKGRHPLLDKHKVVPIDIPLGRDYNLLIVTGPNTGGKTVSLKTVGLFTLMGQAGLHIPAFDRSRLAVFDEVYADIGDEQSIEQSLSTFSSHMTNIVSILQHADRNSLCLFDELGAGTDPTEGAALAIAVLSHLHERGIRTMATTHYSELKVYALSTDRVENACCEFDVESLRPTYRLLIGIPGKSNAFAISSKLGLPDYIIESAKKHISSTDKSFEDLISDLEESRITIEKEREEIKQYKEEIRSLKEKTEQKHERIDQRRESILRDANEQAHKILLEAKAYADETMKNFQKFGKENISAREMEQARSELRQKLSGVEKKLVLKSTQKPKKKKNPEEFKVGDIVKVLTLGLEGTVTTLPNAKGDFYVQMGSLRSQVNVKNVDWISTPKAPTVERSKTGSGKIKMSKSASVSSEIMLIGMTTDEAIAVLDKYLDDAYLAHIPSVRIVHGKGTGALKNAVHQHLKRLKYVDSFRLGVFGEGENGVTIVQFKE